MKLHKYVVVVVLTMSFLCEGQDVPAEPTNQVPVQHASAPAIDLKFPGGKTALEQPDSKLPETSEIIPGRLVHRVNPKYPKEAKNEKIQGTVVLQATVDQNGAVSNLAIIRGDIMLAEAAVDAVQDWRFEAYTRNGRPVQVRQELAFNFVSGEKTGELDAQLPPPILAEGSPIPTGREISSGDTFYEVGNGVTAPRGLYLPTPPYSEAARKAKYQGTCILSLVVGPDGQPRDIEVVRAMGKGLDEQAVETVSKWRFQPATKDGQPVAVQITTEVDFHLY